MTFILLVLIYNMSRWDELLVTLRILVIATTSEFMLSSQLFDSASICYNSGGLEMYGNVAYCRSSDLVRHLD